MRWAQTRGSCNPIAVFGEANGWCSIAYIAENSQGLSTWWSTSIRSAELEPACDETLEVARLLIAKYGPPREGNTRHSNHRQHISLDLRTHARLRRLAELASRREERTVSMAEVVKRALIAYDRPDLHSAIDVDHNDTADADWRDDVEEVAP